MLTRHRMLAALTALFLTFGTVPALADDGTAEEPADTATSTEAVGSHLNGKFLILFAEGLDASDDDIRALADMGFGWGDIFKLSLYSTVLGVSVDDLVAGAHHDDETGEFEFAWGELRQILTDDQLELLETLPRNLGQAVSADKRRHGRDEHQPARGDESGDDEPGDAGSDDEQKDTQPGSRGRGHQPDHAEKGGKSGK